MVSTGNYNYWGLQKYESGENNKPDVEEITR
jgi:hypothetical protein